MKHVSAFKIGLLISLLTLFPFLSYGTLGGAGPGGGKPLLIQQVNPLPSLLYFIKKIKVDHPTLTQSLQKMIAEKKILGFNENCKIIDFPSTTASSILESEKYTIHPRRYWYMKLSGGRVILDQTIFKLPHEKQLQILTELSDEKITPNKSIISEELKIQILDKTGKVMEAIQKIRNELQNPLFHSWISDTFNKEMDHTSFFQIPENCFINLNNQSSSLLDDGYIVSVHGFTQFSSKSNIYFSSEILTYDILELIHIIAAEVGHHLPIGSEASNETTVDTLATIITLGNQSIESQTLMSSIYPRLLLFKLITENKIEIPEGKIITIQRKENEPVLNINIHPAIAQLRSFLNSKELRQAAQSVFNGFNKLLGQIKMSSLLDCKYSYGLYSGVHYDRMVKKTFQNRKPTEMEEIELQLSHLDFRLCPLVNDIIGEAFPELEGYGTSYLPSAEYQCQKIINSNRVQPLNLSDISLEATERKQGDISSESKNKLINLNNKIHSFHKVLCQGFDLYYSRGLTFSGSSLERELILSVIGANVEKVDELLQAGVTPNIHDTRIKHKKYYSDNQRSLIDIAIDGSSDNSSYFAERYKKIKTLLIEAGAHR